MWKLGFGVTPRDTTLVCLQEDGELVGSWLSTRFISMSLTGIQPIDSDDDATYMLYPVINTVSLSIGKPYNSEEGIDACGPQYASGLKFHLDIAYEYHHTNFMGDGKSNYCIEHLLANEALIPHMDDEIEVRSYYPDREYKGTPIKNLNICWSGAINDVILRPVVHDALKHEVLQFYGYPVEEPKIKVVVIEDEE